MLLRLDMASRTPIYMQIRNQVVLGIAAGQRYARWPSSAASI